MMRAPDQSLPPFHARNEAERQDMKDYLCCRMYADDGADEHRDWYAPLPPDAAFAAALCSAKSAARNGNLQPLAKLLSTVMGDREITDFIAVPPRGRGRQPSRADHFRQYGREGIIDTVRRIRQIWREDFGRVKRNRQYDDSAEKIAAEILGHGLDEQAVRQLMKKAKSS
jgi:hypothetical protein